MLITPEPNQSIPQTLIVGCGNLLRGDDGVGPVLIRHILDYDLPEHIQVVDGGTAGMDVAFRMRGMDRVVLIDASQSGSKPGTIYRVPGDEVENLPPLEGLHLHAFRWDHALAFARWLLKDEYPADITVYLIEAANIDFGDELSPSVTIAMKEVIQMLLSDLSLTLVGGVER
ncbi:MAG: hydrogenase maturation protease [Pseudomonadota bacterium]